MTDTTLAAFTPPPGDKIGAVVPYINITKSEDGITVTVRQKGGDLRNPVVAAIALSDDEFFAVLASAFHNLSEDDKALLNAKVVALAT